MTRDDIISMARETRVYDQEWRYNMRDEQEALERFANLVAECVATAEREACALAVLNSCFDYQESCRAWDAIRARSQS